jgi:hypothetical protein
MIINAGFVWRGFVFLVRVIFYTFINHDLITSRGGEINPGELS